MEVGVVAVVVRTSSARGSSRAVAAAVAFSLRGRFVSPAVIAKHLHLLLLAMVVLFAAYNRPRAVALLLDQLVYVDVRAFDCALRLRMSVLVDLVRSPGRSIECLFGCACFFASLRASAFVHICRCVFRCL